MKLLIFLSIVLVSCGVGTEKFEQITRQEGITNVVDDGYAVFGCAREDTFKSKFHGMKNGVPVSGYICGGGLKGYTVRYQ